MYPNSALSAGQLAIMAVVVVVSLAAWLILVALAARQPRGTSAAADARPREEETAATVTRLPSGGRPADKTAALSVKAAAGVRCTWHGGRGNGYGISPFTERNRVNTGCTITWRCDDRLDCKATDGGSVDLAG
jgi:hypothetical protein